MQNTRVLQTPQRVFRDEKHPAIDSSLSGESAQSTVLAQRR
jgi:hypothetical protein